jgi:3'(2'), 5'-bisphosphate nucleotidase
MNTRDFNHFLQPVCNIAIQAGIIINTYYKLKTEVSFKKDRSPLTEADLASNKFIINSLSEINKDIPILSEESLVDWNIRKNWTRYWLVDPLDGTKEFINQNGEFTVNIALIEKNEPIIGVIYAPALSTLYYASKNKGTYKLFCDQKINSLSDSTRIITNHKKSSEHFKIFKSRSHSNEEFENWVKDYVDDYELIEKGSSIKFCKLAEGKADLYPRFGSTSEWDIAAGHIILTEAGGVLESVDHKKILYNNKESVINPHFIASCRLNN